ncbi:MAG: histidinol phosphate phosphatase [Flaviaesturariibacter sp.]|nr:histidinol phosphate phosphatase [Flaviaesturariibacter sp.]
MQVTEAIILAGGLGTRLREAVPDRPKCMAPVAGRPFMSHVIDELRMQGIQRFIFSLGYMADVIQDYLKEAYPTLDYTAIVEEEPLGTGGAIQACLRQAITEHVLVANGDTLFKVALKDLAAVHKVNKAACTLALKKMQDFNRYGVVALAETGAITGFQEKKHYTEGLINGGIYLLQKEPFLRLGLPEKFSFEKEYLEPGAEKGWLFGTVQEGYFIDIGIPGDFQQAQTDLQRTPLDLKDIDKTWTLFLDRDGVINNETLGKYVLHWGEFIFSPGVLEAFKILSGKFGHIILVTNQRGVSKGLMNLEDLNHIHKEMQKEVEAAGGRIDAIYYCIDKGNTSFYRKPNPGMAFQAKQDFPQIDLSKAIMVGNKPSDAAFGRAAGIYTVFVTTTNPDQTFPHPHIDILHPTLLEFARSLQS